jgi:flavin-dependent dehydrogenase
MNKTIASPKHYDVVIVGAGMAGLTCAKTLGNSNLKVLLLEKNPKFHEKICAAGISQNDIEFIPSRYWHADFQPLTIQHRGTSLEIYPTDGVITSIDRSRYLKELYDEVKKLPNITSTIPSALATIYDDHSIKLSTGEQISFEYLVGADGSNSSVRQYLNIPTKDMMLAIQYIVPSRFPKFTIHLEDEIGRYCWIFPYRDTTSIGCGSSINLVTPEQLRNQFDRWIKNRNIDITGARLQAAVINTDYRGFEFGNVFLVGDASGITSDLTGKGIYTALFMGTFVANKILGLPTDDKKFKKLLTKKRIMDVLAKLAEFGFTRRLLFSIGMRLARSARLQRLGVRLGG